MLMMLLELAAQASEEAGGHTSFGPMEFWAAAGREARAVILTLSGLSLICLLVWIERLIAFSRARRQSMRVAAEVVGPLQSGGVAGALNIASDEKYKASYLASVLAAGLKEIKEHPNEFGVENAERAVEKAIAEEVAKLKRGFA